MSLLLFYFYRFSTLWNINHHHIITDTHNIYTIAIIEDKKAIITIQQQILLFFDILIYFLRLFHCLILLDCQVTIIIYISA